MKYRRSPAPKKIGPYEAVLRDALAANARRLRRERRTARKHYAQLQAQGFPGSYRRVTEFIRTWRTEQAAVSARAAYVPLGLPGARRSGLTGARKVLSSAACGAGCSWRT